MTALLHPRWDEVPSAPPLLPARALICSGSHRQRMRHMALGNRGFCEVCLDRSRSAVSDDELGGEC